MRVVVIGRHKASCESISFRDGDGDESQAAETERVPESGGGTIE